MQLVWNYPDADERYVSDKGWRKAILPTCPFHPTGGCGLATLGSYPRVSPPGTRVARFWCPLARRSVSLLPSFLAARLVGTLAAVEDVVAAVEGAGSAAAVVDTVHPPDLLKPLGIDCALRSIRRRVRSIHAALKAIVTLLPDVFLGVRPTVTALRAALGTTRALEAARGLAAAHLAGLSAPLGFRPRSSR